MKTREEITANRRQHAPATSLWGGVGFKCPCCRLTGRQVVGSKMRRVDGLWQRVCGPCCEPSEGATTP